MTRAPYALLLSAVLLVGCASNISPNSYSAGSVGQVNRTVAGTVISVRAVSVDSDGGGGALVGGTAGAVAGSSVGGGTRANALGAIGGALVGAAVGSAIQRNNAQQTGMEYVVQTENANLLTVVQGDSPAFPVGARVLVLYGSPSRVIADPRQPN